MYSPGLRTTDWMEQSFQAMNTSCPRKCSPGQSRKSSKCHRWQPQRTAQVALTIQSLPVWPLSLHSTLLTLQSLHLSQEASGSLSSSRPHANEKTSAIHQGNNLLFPSQSKEEPPQGDFKSGILFSHLKVVAVEPHAFHFSCIFISLSSNQGNLCSWLNLRVFSQPGGCGWLYPWGVVLEKEFLIFPETKKSKKGKKKKKRKMEPTSCDIRLQLASMKPKQWAWDPETSSSLIMLSHKTFEAMAITGTPSQMVTQFN